MMEVEEEERSVTTPEQCFYASFKIYLSDSRKNSVCESEESDSVHSEVVRIEKTLEVSDDCPSEDDKTLSNSGDLLGDDKDDTDIEDEIETFPATSRPKLGLTTEHERILKRSLSESDDTPGLVEQPPRNSRGLTKADTRQRYERTQSMDRAVKEEPSPVFYLDPLDWIRSEGSSPLPLKDKSPSKLLENFNTGPKHNLDILTESEENLNSEIEKINNNIMTATAQRTLADQRNSSLPNFRLQTPTIELTREDCSTPDQGYSSTLSFRSITQGVPLIEKTRRTTIPLLCSRPGSACDKRLRKKSSCVSSEDVNQGVRKISRKTGCHVSSEDIRTQMRRLSRMTPEDDKVMSASLHHLGRTEAGLQQRCFCPIM